MKLIWLRSTITGVSSMTVLTYDSICFAKTPAKDEFKQNIDIEENQEPKAVLNRDHIIHLAKAGKAKSSLKADGTLAKEYVNTLTRDFQKALPFPKLTVSEAYYRIYVYCSNFGPHDMGKNLG